MTDQEIIDLIRNRGYPSDLLDAEILALIDDVLLDLQEDWPMWAYGSFETVAGQQIYDPFSATVDVPTQQGVLPGGLYVLELIGSPSSLGSEGDVFGIVPLLQGGGYDFGLLPFNRWSFSTPGDLTLWETNWHGFIKRYGTLWFEPTASTPGASFRLMPVPDCARTVLVRYTKNRTDTEVRETNPSMFMAFIEAGAAQILANKYSATAGIKIEQLEDKGKTLEYWWKRAREHMEEGNRLLERQNDVALDPAQRS